MEFKKMKKYDGKKIINSKDVEVEYFSRKPNNVDTKSLVQQILDLLKTHKLKSIRASR